MKTKLLYALQPCFGITISTVCAFALAKAFTSSHWKLAAPVLLAVVLVLLASRFGAVISVTGSLIAAAIFSWMLFLPMHSLHVDDEMERDSLHWMILFSVSLSYLLYPTRRPKTALESAPESVYE